nr:retropepsin-like aspartic protease [Marinisporobacter balticus]
MHNNKKVTLKNVLIDTGSASTIISSDVAIDLDLGPSPEDELFRIRGVGGSEYVYEKHIDKIQLETVIVSNLKLDVGAMDYGFDIDAILGMDFLKKAKVVIDIDKMMLYSS